MSVISIRQLGRSYGARRGISNVNLSIEEGQIFGFLGPNGAGKTTTIRIMLGFLKPDHGSANILDLDCWKKSHLVKQHVGYVPGDVRLYPWLTLNLGLQIIGKIRKRDLVADGKHLADRFCLEPGLPVRKMSRGNRQKVALVLALVHQPRVIVLDEPTSGLDPTVQITLMNLLKELAAMGSTVLFSSHTLSEVEQVCDRVAMIKAGEIVVNETLSELKLKSPRTVFVTTSSETPASGVEWPQGLRVLRMNGTQAQLQLFGPSVDFLKWASGQSFRDISVGQPSLESLFHSYYEN